jgi:hypothetical protein
MAAAVLVFMISLGLPPRLRLRVALSDSRASMGTPPSIGQAMEVQIFQGLTAVKSGGFQLSISGNMFFLLLHQTDAAAVSQMQKIYTAGQKASAHCKICMVRK